MRFRVGIVALVIGCTSGASVPVDSRDASSGVDWDAKVDRFAPSGDATSDRLVAPDAWICPDEARSLECPLRADPSTCDPLAGGTFPAFCPQNCAVEIEAPHCPVPTKQSAARVLLFTRFVATSEGGWAAHPAHCWAEKNLTTCGRARGWTVTQTRDPSVFESPSLLQDYDVVVFAMTNHEVFTNAAQKAGLQAFVRAGKGFAGLHSASATFFTGPGGSYTWDWYGHLLGDVIFLGHPGTLTTNALHGASNDPIVAGLPDPWVRCEENYAHRPNPADNPKLEILLWMDEECPGFDAPLKMGGRHPLSFRHVYDGGRVFYTALGHAKEAYYEAPFLEHVGRGIEWASGL